MTPAHGAGWEHDVALQHTTVCSMQSEHAPTKLQPLVMHIHFAHSSPPAPQGLALSAGLHHVPSLHSGYSNEWSASGIGLTLRLCWSFLALDRFTSYAV